MSFDYSPLANVATELLGIFGTDVTITSADGEETIMKGVTEDKVQRRRGDNGQLTETAIVKHLYIEAIELPPQPLDTVVIGDVNYTIASVNEVKPGPTTV